MAPLLEGASLQEAIRTTLGQLCKVALPYQSELAIEGTIGVTVDKRQVIMVHFSEHVEQPSGVDSSCRGIPSDAGTVNTASRPQEIGSLAQLQSSPVISTSRQAEPVIMSQLHGSPVISTSKQPEVGPVMQLHSSPPTLSSKGNPDPVMSQASSRFQHLPSWYGQSSSNPGCVSQSGLKMDEDKTYMDGGPEMMDVKSKLLSMPISGTTIDLDADSETFSPLGFEDEVDTSCGIRKFSQEDGPIFMHKKEPDCAMYEEEVELEGPQDMKDIIIIEDQTDLMEETSLEAQAREFGPLQDMEAEAKKSPTGDVDVKDVFVSHGLAAVPKTELLWTEPAGSLAASALMQFSQGVQQTRVKESADLPESIDFLDASALSKSYHTCKICGKILTSVAPLEAHLVETHNITKLEGIGDIPHLTCPHCNKKFRFQATLDKHSFLHVSDKPYKCTVLQCGNAYKYPESLAIHMASHSKDYSCKPCHKVYSTKQLFQKHIVYMHEMRRTSKKDRQTQAFPQAAAAASESMANSTESNLG